MWQRLFGGGWRTFKVAEHAHFGDILVSAIFDWKGWVLAGLGWAVTFGGTSYSGYDPWAVWLASLFAGACIATMYIALRLFRSRAVAPLEPDIDATAELARAELAKQRRLQDNLFRESQRSMELAGLVNAILERAGSYNFKLPLPADDPWIKQHEELKNSTHPIWTDTAINQLRRDFLQFCYIVGSGHEVRETAAETQADHAELHKYGRQLIARLRGDPIDEWVSLADAATELYTEFRGKFAGTYFEGEAKSREERLDNTALHIAVQIPIEAKHPPSTKWEIIPEEDLQDLIIYCGATAFKLYNASEPCYIEPRIKRSDLDRLIQSYKEEEEAKLK